MKISNKYKEGQNMTLFEMITDAYETEYAKVIYQWWYEKVLEIEKKEETIKRRELLKIRKARQETEEKIAEVKKPDTVIELDHPIVTEVVGFMKLSLTERQMIKRIKESTMNK